MSDDLVAIARLLTPTEAFLMEACLRASGVAARVADAHLVQANDLWFYALGGARVLVPVSQVEAARAVLAAREEGALAIDEDFDVGESED